MHGSWEWKMSWALSHGCVQASTDVPALDWSYLLCPTKMQTMEAPPMIESVFTQADGRLGPIVRTPRDLEDCNVPQAPAMAIGVDRM